MPKAAEAFRTISEVADDLGIQKHVLRFWEVKFSQIRPMKRGGGRRYYRPEDMELLRGIRQLLHRDGYTIKGVQKILREQGVEAVKARARPEGAEGAEQAGPAPAANSVAPHPKADGMASPAGRKALRKQPPAIDRLQVLRSALAELEACREILAGRPPAAESEKPAAARRVRRTA